MVLCFKVWHPIGIALVTGTYKRRPKSLVRSTTPPGPLSDCRTVSTALPDLICSSSVSHCRSFYQPVSGTPSFGQLLASTACRAPVECVGMGAREGGRARVFKDGRLCAHNADLCCIAAFYFLAMATKAWGVGSDVGKVPVKEVVPFVVYEHGLFLFHPTHDPASNVKVKERLLLTLSCRQH